MKRRKYLLACLLAGVTIAMPTGQLSFAAGAQNDISLMAESESQSETQSESQSESETQTQDPNVPEGYKGIYKVSDLSLLSSKPDGKYMLMADLDLNSAEQASISVFRGTLDGNNHTIKGLKQALFQVLEEGTVSNLNLSGVQISGSGDTGALANVIGTGKKSAVTIQNITITGSVTGTGNTGSLAGVLKGTDVVISRIANSATVAGTANAGGLIGLVQATDDQEGAASVKLTESYNIGEVSAVTAGGLIGAAEIPNLAAARNIEIANCYNAGVLEKGANIVAKITAGNGQVVINKCVGIQFYYSVASGMVGTSTMAAGSTQTSGCSISNSYYYSMNPVYAFETGNCITGTATALNDVQIKTQSYFKDFDFDGIWALNAAENGGYPYLKQTTMLPVSYVAPTAGTVLIDSKTGGKYLVSTRSKAVSYAGVLDEEITSVSIPSQVEINGITYNVTAIAEGALRGNTKITYVSVPYSVTEVGKYAFKGCTSLVKVSTLKYVKNIYQEAFDGCTNLTTIGVTNYRITLPSVEMIGVRAFRRVPKVHRVYISSKNLTTIKKGAFRECTGMTKFNVVSTKLNSLQKYALYGNSKLKTVIFKSEHLTKSNVGSKTFSGIKSTATFTVPAGSVQNYKDLFKSKGAGSKFKVKSL